MGVTEERRVCTERVCACLYSSIHTFVLACDCIPCVSTALCGLWQATRLGGSLFRQSRGILSCEQSFFPIRMFKHLSCRRVAHVVFGTHGTIHFDSGDGTTVFPSLGARFLNAGAIFHFNERQRRCLSFTPEQSIQSTCLACAHSSGNYSNNNLTNRTATPKVKNAFHYWSPACTA